MMPNLTGAETSRAGSNLGPAIEAEVVHIDPIRFPPRTPVVKICEQGKDGKFHVVATQAVMSAADEQRIANIIQWGKAGLLTGSGGLIFGLLVDAHASFYWGTGLVAAGGAIVAAVTAKWAHTRYGRS